MSLPLVSILIPCYNAGRWLAATLESALAQTWPHLEIIVVDDGSRDDSPAIARSFEERGVRLILQPNAGASAARNRALRESHGEFLQFLDADDLLSPGKIAAQIALLRLRPADAVASCAWGRFTADPVAAHFVDTPVFRDLTPVAFLILAGDTGAMMHPSAWLVPRSVAEKAGPWNETLSLNDDGEYFARVLLASTGVFFCSDSLAQSYYRSGLPGSLSQQRGDRARKSQFTALILIGAHLLRAEDSPPTRRAAANFLQRFIYEFYPEPANLMRAAAERVAELGGASLTQPEMGAKTARLSRLIGWKFTARLKAWLQK
jgi:glycosyltransferase involved in cell wall biosynthesis